MALQSSGLTVDELLEALHDVSEELYAEAVSKAGYALFFCLSDLTRTPNEFLTAYFPSK